MDSLVSIDYSLMCIILKIYRRSIFFDQQNHCFFRNEKSKKIFIFNIKIFYILKFEKKSLTFFPPKTFPEKKFYPIFITILHTHTSKVVCVWTKNRRFLKFLNCFQFKMEKRR